MANIANEPWMDPAKNAVTTTMEGTLVKPVMLIDPTTGDPTGGGGGGGGGDASAANQTTQIGLSEKDVWDRIVGNSIEFTYYAGVEAGNPSGSTDNLKTAVYKDGVTTEFTQTFTYDATDKVLTVVCS